MNLKEKLIEVSKAIEYLQKDKKNKMQGYSYLSEAKIKATIKSKFEEHGILFNYSTTSIREYEISPTSKNNKQFCTIASGIYRFIDTESDELIEGEWQGSGTDTGDKGLYKAITGGIKYVLNTNFLIPTGEDPENDEINNGNGQITDDKQLKKDLMRKHSGDKEAAKKEYQEILEQRKLEENFEKELQEAVWTTLP